MSSRARSDSSSKCSRTRFSTPQRHISSSVKFICVPGMFWYFAMRHLWLRVLDEPADASRRRQPTSEGARTSQSSPTNLASSADASSPERLAETWSC